MSLMMTEIPASQTDEQTGRIVANVTGLNPYTQYKFRAIGVNSLGEGRPSKPSREYSAVSPNYNLTLCL